VQEAYETGQMGVGTGAGLAAQELFEESLDG
jgi:hypothetical protein